MALAAVVVEAAVCGIWMKGFATKPCAAFCEPWLLLKIISGKNPNPEKKTLKQVF
jgi:hypothetical protein